MQLSQASALILCMFCATILSLLGITLWKRTGMLCDIMCEHQSYCKRFAKTEYLLEAGLKLMVKNNELFLDKTMEKSYPVQYRASCSMLSCDGTITIARQKKSQKLTTKFIIKAQLKEEEKQTFRLSCCVQKRTNAQGKPYVDVSCFTIG